MANLPLIWAMTLFQPQKAPTLPKVSPSDPDKISLKMVQSATTNSMMQTMILATIFDAYAEGKLDLSAKKNS